MTRDSLQAIAMIFVHREGICFTIRDQESNIDELWCTTALLSTTLTLWSQFTLEGEQKKSTQTFFKSGGNILG